MLIKFKQYTLLCLFIFLSGCEQRYDLAPVVESKWRATQHATTHRVLKGETLYAIAFRYDLDFRQLAQMNHLTSPYTLRVGQILRVNSSYTQYRPEVVTRAPQANVPSRPKTKTYPTYSPPVYSRSNGRWLMPANGKVVVQFAPQLGHKGINISGLKGDKIRASQNGVVAYAGNGLAGYGNLIIIKHDNQYMTAYGNNSRNLVKEGQFVKSGQIIADMGIIDQRYWGVHFEIRNLGKPVNPGNYL